MGVRVLFWVVGHQHDVSNLHRTRVCVHVCFRSAEEWVAELLKTCQRKEVDEEGNEVDPRKELIDKILEYKKFKKDKKAPVEKQVADLDMVVDVKGWKATGNRLNNFQVLTVTLLPEEMKQTSSEDSGEGQMELW